MRKRVLYSVLVTALGLNLLIGAQIYFKSAQAAEKENIYPQIELFMRVLERVRQDYVDDNINGEKLTYERLIHGALRGMLKTLDPYSEYMEPPKYTNMRDDMEGAYGGVGIVIGQNEGFLQVISPMEDSPAFKAGILKGDKIIKIDGKPAEKLTSPDAMKKLRGAPGTDVTLGILRTTSSGSKELEFKLTRAAIKMNTVKDINDHREFPVSENKIGYLRITQFGEHTSEEFQAALKKMHAQEMAGLVMDLRNNPGGLLDQAVEVCDTFLPRGQLIVSTEGRSARMKSEEYKARGRDQYPDLKIVILVNNGSASAAEIVAGCLQDLGRAFVMGERSFGKGSVQSILPMPDGSALRLTTAKYYTPSHKVIHEQGITPDSVVQMNPEDEEALQFRRSPGGVDALDEPLRARVLAVRDIQLERAQDFLKAMTLYKERLAQKKPAQVAHQAK
ncbi:MAG TPA: S41 family peptidase [Verrucomicrobiae bacterium]|nr:S41 family peptidase [Verrucomicrobiae bacterium]